MLPRKIRVSIGSASRLGLRRIIMDVEPTNCHLLTYNSEGCLGNCSFCPQSQYTFNLLKNEPDSQEFLSRVSWPAFETKKVINLLNNEPKFKRICLQSLNYHGFEKDLESILDGLKHLNIPISIAIPPVEVDYIQIYKDNGTERICFALDTPTKELFDLIKGEKNEGPYKWDEHLNLLKKSVEIFGRGYVTTHLIIGMGETEKEALEFIENMKKIGILTGLFAFTPLKKTKFEKKSKPDIITYRKIQLGKYLIDTNRKKIEEMEFDSFGNLTSFNIQKVVFEKLLNLGTMFQTSGCPSCNRPYYTSSPSKEQYNYPRPLKDFEKEIIFEELIKYIEE